MSKEVNVIHLKEVLKQLEVAKIYKQTVSLSFWSLKDGEKIDLENWQPVHCHWRHPAIVRLYKARSRQFREVRVITIYRFNNKEVYV